MAQTKKTSTKSNKSAKSTKSASAKKTGTTRQSAPPEPVVPIRRELGGVIFFFISHLNFPSDLERF